MFNDQFTFYYVTDIIQFAETSVPSRPFLLRNANGFLSIDVDVMSILIRVSKMCVIFENKLAQSYRRKFHCLKREASVPAFFTSRDPRNLPLVNPSVESIPSTPDYRVVLTIFLPVKLILN